jgi:O-antigen/teichoic acid export membrane protein
MTSTPDAVTGLRRVGVPAGTVAAASLLANVLVYGSALVLNRALTPDDLGAVAALLAVIVLAGIPALALQLVAARHVATGRSGAGRAALSTGAALGAAASGIVLVAMVPLQTLFALDGPLPVALAAATVFPTFLVYAVQGCLHGEERFVALGALYLATAGLRLAAAAVAGVAGLGVPGVVGLTAVGTWLAALVAVTMLGPHRHGTDSTSRWTRWLVAVLRGSTSTAALLAVTTMDTPLARAFLTPGESGQYAVLTVFSKAAFWGPAFLATLFYPRMARGSTRFGPVAGVTSTIAVAVVTVLAATFLADPLIRIVGGAGYASLGADVGLFAAVGATWSVVQMLVYWRLARGDHRLGYAVWFVASACALVIGTGAHDSIREIAATMLLGGLSAAVYGLMLLVTARRRRHRLRPEGPSQRRTGRPVSVPRRARSGPPRH